MLVNTKTGILVYVSIAIIFFLGATGYVRYQKKTVTKETAKWTIHSSDVESAMIDAKGAYALAETRGRYATFDEESRQTFPKLFRDSLNLLKVVKEKVADNQTQIENIDRIESAINRRYETLNQTIAAARIVDGKLVSEPSLVTAGVDAQNKTLLAFAVFENTEKTLKNDRLEKTFSALDSIENVDNALYIVLIVLVAAGFFWTWWELRTMGELVEDAENNENVPVAVAQMIIKKIENRELTRIPK